VELRPQAADPDPVRFGLMRDALDLTEFPLLRSRMRFLLERLPIAQRQKGLAVRQEKSQ